MIAYDSSAEMIKHFRVDKMIRIGQLDMVREGKDDFKKIEMSDAIYVVNIDGYIGEQVKKEIAFAQKLGKEVILHTDFIN